VIIPAQHIVFSTLILQVLILVEFYPDADMDLIKFVELEEYLSDLLGIKVDLVMKSALKPRTGKCVLNRSCLYTKREAGDFIKDIINAMDKA